MTIFSDTTNSELNPLEQLVGEDKRYKTPEELAKAAIEKDNFIEQLKRETQGMREDLARLQLEKASLQQKQAETPVQPPQERPPEVKAPAINEEEIVSRVLQRQQELTEKQKAEVNLKEVSDRLIELYGSEQKAAETLKNRALELGVTVEFLKDAAAKSPTLFYKSLGLDTTSQPSPTSSKAGVNSAALQQANQQAPVYSKAWWDNLRRTNPTEYWKPANQQLLFRQAAEKGGYSKL